MGIFTKDTKPKTSKASSAKKEAKSVEKKVLTGSTDVTSLDLSKILRNPRITEKAAHLSEGSVYTFDVAPKATKMEIKKAIKALYGVEAEKINVTAIPKKAVYRRGGKGVKGGGKKAYVQLEKGQTIEFV